MKSITLPSNMQIGGTIELDDYGILTITYSHNNAYSTQTYDMYEYTHVSSKVKIGIRYESDSYLSHYHIVPEDIQLLYEYRPMLNEIPDNNLAYGIYYDVNGHVRIHRQNSYENDYGSFYYDLDSNDLDDLQNNWNEIMQRVIDKWDAITYYAYNFRNGITLCFEGRGYKSFIIDSVWEYVSRVYINGSQVNKENIEAYNMGLTQVRRYYFNTDGRNYITLEFITIPDKCFPTGIIGGITDAIVGYNITYITQVFGNSSIRSIHLLNYSTYALDAMAFKDTHELHYMYIPDNITDMGGSTFTGSTVCEIRLPRNASINRINSSFAVQTATGCPLKSLYIPDCYTEIEADAFKYCTTLKYIKFPNSLSIIGANAFEKCGNSNSLIDLYFDSNNLSSIDNFAFKGSYLGNIIWENSVNGLTFSLGEGVFQEAHLNRASVPNGLKFISDSLFKSSDIYAAYNYYNNSDYLPDSVTVIQSYAFAYCENLTYFPFNENTSSLTTIQSHAFDGCIEMCSNDYQLTLPPSCRTIFDYAFANCTNIKKVYFKYNGSATIQVNSSAFNECTNLTDVYFTGTYSDLIVYNNSFPQNTTIHLGNNISDSKYREIQTSCAGYGWYITR